MNLIKMQKDRIVIEFSKEELDVFVNALNEVCNGIQIKDFESKIGCNIEKARFILKLMIFSLNNK